MYIGSPTKFTWTSFCVHTKYISTDILNISVHTQKLVQVKNKYTSGFHREVGGGGGEGGNLEFPYSLQEIVLRYIIRLNQLQGL